MKGRGTLKNVMEPALTSAPVSVGILQFVRVNVEIFEIDHHRIIFGSSQKPPMEDVNILSISKTIDEDVNILSLIKICYSFMFLSCKDVKCTYNLAASVRFIFSHIRVIF